MTWPIRLKISGVTMLCGMVIKTGVFSHASDRYGARGSNSAVPMLGEGWKSAVPDPARVAFNDPETVVVRSPAHNAQMNLGSGSHRSYQTILDRNPFRLRPPVPIGSTPVPTGEPKEDLFLTGMASIGSRCALFMVTEPGKPPIYFRLAEGEQNEWLEVKAVEFDSGTVTARLNKPCVRIRGVGAEVVLSFDAHGVSNH